MGEDGNTIEIRIDAADTLAAAESASDSNKKLQQFKAALDLFSTNVESLAITTLETADVLKDLSNLFADLPQRLKERIELMHEQVLSNVEPILEKNINDMTARVIERVCGSVQGPEASRTAVQTADGKVPSTQAVSPPPSVVTAKQPDEFKRPDAMIQHVFGGVGSTISDAITGAATNTRQERSRTEATRFQSWEEEINGETIQFRETIKDISNSVSKVVTKSTGFYGVEQKLTPEQKKVQQQFGFLEQPIGKRDIELSDKGVHRAMGALPKDVGENFVDGFRDAMEPFFAEREDAADHYRKQTEQLNRQALSNWKKPNAFSGIDVEDLTKYNKEMRDIVPIFKEAKKVEHDRAAAIRKEITGALIAVHVMKVTAQGSQVFSAGLQIVNAGFSHLLNNLMLPMMPMFIIIGQSLHWLANVVAMLPMPIRQLIGFLMIWKATSMLVSAMPIKEVLAGTKEMFATLRGGGNVFGTFVKLVKAFVNFMNSGIGSGGGGAAVLGGIKGAGGFIKGLGKRALGFKAKGGPVWGDGAYVVGEAGPELFVPEKSGTIIPNDVLSQIPGKAKREAGGPVTVPGGITPVLTNEGGGTDPGTGGEAPTTPGFLDDPMGFFFGGLGGLLSGGVEGLGDIIGSVVSSDLGISIISSLNMITGVIAGILAPIAPIMGIIGAVAGVALGRRGGGAGGGGDRTAETVARFGTEQIKATSKMNYGIQSGIGMGARGTNKVLAAILMRIGQCLFVAPCGPGLFGGGIPELIPTLAAITALITGILDAILALPKEIYEKIKISIADIAAKIKYYIEVIGEKPVVQDIIAKIRYIREIVGKIPVPEKITSFIDYIRRIVGAEPKVENMKAYIDYIRRVTGEVPKVGDLKAYIDYTIRTTGKLPTTTDIKAFIDYYYRVNGTVPLPSDIIAWIQAKFKTLNPEEVKKLTETIETALKENPPKVAVEANELKDKIAPKQKVLSDGSLEVETADTKNVKPSDKVVKGGSLNIDKVIPPSPEVTRGIFVNVFGNVIGARDATVGDQFINVKGKVYEVVAKEGTEFTLKDIKGELVVKKVFFPADSDINKPIEMEANIQPEVDADFLRAELQRALENLNQARANRLKLSAEWRDETWQELSKEIENWEFDVKDIEARIAQIDPPKDSRFLVIDGMTGQLRTLDGSTLTDNIVDVNGRVSEIIEASGRRFVIDMFGEVREITIPDAVYEGWNAGREVLGIPAEYKLSPEAYAKLQAENKAIEARLAAGGDAVKVPTTLDSSKIDPVAWAKGIDWKAAGSFAGELIGVTILQGITEAGKTGKIDGEKMAVNLGIGAVAGVIGGKIAVGLAGYLGGPTAAGIVGAGLSGLWTVIAAKTAADAIEEFVGSLQRGFRNMKIDASGITTTFGNSFLDAAKNAGASFKEWFETSFHVDLPENAFAIAGMALGTGMELMVKPNGNEWLRIFGDFYNNVRSVLAGGIPVDVRIDVASVTSVVEAIRETAGGTPISGGASTPDEVVQECQPGYYWDRALQQCAPIQGSVIPSHAFGGTVLPKVPTLVGERGPEMVIPTTGGTVITNNELGKAFGGGTSNASQNVTINQTFNVTSNNPREITDTVMRELKLELARVKM